MLLSVVSGVKIKNLNIASSCKIKHCHFGWKGVIGDCSCLLPSFHFITGNFGCVLEGELHGKDHEEPLRVAVKTLLDPVTHAIDLQGFIDEALLMKNFNHEHVLGLLGLSEGDRGLPLVVLPFMERGDLLTYVKNESTVIIKNPLFIIL